MLMRGVLVALLASSRFAADPAVHRIYVADRGDLLVTIPPGWTSAAHERLGDAGAATLTAPGGDARMDIVQSVKPFEPRPTTRRLKREAEALRDQVMRTGKASDVEMIELKGAAAMGYAVTARAEAQPPYDSLTRVSMLVGEVPILAQLQWKHAAPAAHEQGLEALKSLALDPGVLRVREGEVSIPDPTGRWFLVVAAPNVSGGPIESKFNSRAMVANLRKGGAVAIVLSIDPAAKPGGATVARDAALDDALAHGAARENFQIAGDEKIAYLINTVPQRAMKQTQVFTVQGGMWAEVRLVDMEYNPQRQPIMDGIVRGVRIEPRVASTTAPATPTPSPTSRP